MMTLCPALQEKFSGDDAFEQIFATEGKIYRNFKGRKTLRFEHEGKGYFLKIHPGVGWGEVIKSLLLVIGIDPAPEARYIRPRFGNIQVGHDWRIAV